MTLFLDTNILVDYYAPVPRPHSLDAERIFNFCRKDGNTGVVSSLSLSTFFYVLRKAMTVAERKADIRDIARLFMIGAVDVHTIETALLLDMNDYEDAIQAACARDYYADVIITNDKRDFSNSPIAFMTSSDFVNLYCA